MLTYNWFQSWSQLFIQVLEANHLQRVEWNMPILLVIGNLFLLVYCYLDKMYYIFKIWLVFHFTIANLRQSQLKMPFYGHCSPSVVMTLWVPPLTLMKGKHRIHLVKLNLIIKFNGHWEDYVTSLFYNQIKTESIQSLPS